MRSAAADDLKDTRLQLVEASLECLPLVTTINVHLDAPHSGCVKPEDALRKASPQTNSLVSSEADHVSALLLHFDFTDAVRSIYVGR